uniref:Uncharacterized protein n=1 Tax=Lotus japonicus TaxID=34305 RepID=I3TA10_LOTJA|nr:unknown [Lotus japonicus]
MHLKLKDWSTEGLGFKSSFRPLGLNCASIGSVKTLSQEANLNNKRLLQSSEYLLHIIIAIFRKPTGAATRHEEHRIHQCTSSCRVERHHGLHTETQLNRTPE